MTDPTERPLPEGPVRAEWVAATEQARVLVERGPIVVGVSLQAALAGLAVLMFALGTTLAVLEPSPWKAIVSGAGCTVAVVGWMWARRHGGLEPFLPSGEPSPASLLDRGQRRSLRSQMRGKTRPTPQTAELVDLLTRRQRASATNIWPTLVGYGVTLVGANLSSGVIVLGFLGLGVFVAILSWIERRRQQQVRAAISRVSSSGSDED